MTGERLSILAVEDEAMIAMELEDMLEDLGLKVIGPASTVKAALALLRNSSPDAAIVDANLAGESAKPVVEALKSSGVPVIITSGYETLELRNLGLEASLVTKPYGADDLSEALRTIGRMERAPTSG